MLEAGRRAHHPLSVLADAETMGGNTSTPSWVPVWNGQRPGILSPWTPNDPLSASKGLEFYLDTSIPRRITVHGLCVSTVHQICNRLVSDANDMTFNIDWLNQFPTTASCLQVYSRTFCAGRNADGCREYDRNAMALPFVAFAIYGVVPGMQAFLWSNACRNVLPEEDRDPWREEYRNDRLASLIGWNDRWLDARRRFGAAAWLACRQRRLLVSASGHLGLGPGGAAPGDEIWVLAGAATPFILRPFGGGHKMLVGPCYIDDIMEGEAVTAASSGRRHRGPLWSGESEEPPETGTGEDFTVQRVVIE
jgi:hypothetical protein